MQNRRRSYQDQRLAATDVRFVWQHSQISRLALRYWTEKEVQSFWIPIISVGNVYDRRDWAEIPHVEYLIRLLHDKVKIAVLSRGYKRKTSGYVLADKDTTMSEIGDEPFQMHSKFDDIYVAVDAKRVRGIEKLQNEEPTKDVDVVLLDDAFQHRYVKPGINILLVDYHRLIIYDKMLPAGS